MNFEFSIANFRLRILISLALWERGQGEADT
jgi:hypothetical protein